MSMQDAAGKMRIIGLVTILLLLVFAAYVRIHNLGLASYRADELNQYSVVARGQTIADLWKNPPWMNQIPMAEIFAVASSRLMPGGVSEFKIRFPFALMGIITVALCAFGSLRRWGIVTGCVVALWMGLNPFHLYQSREAYYYVMLMLFSGGSVFSAMALIKQLDQREKPSWRNLAMWAVWIVLACHMHMSMWVFAGVQWLVLLSYGWRNLAGDIRRQYMKRLLMLGGIIAVVMSRWIYRALTEVFVTSVERGGHIGAELSWVLPRVLPTFLGGYNWLGGGLIALVFLSAAWTLRKRWSNEVDLRSLSWIAGGGLLGSLIFVLLIGGGTGKITYFSAVMPAILVWCSVILAPPALTGLGRIRLGVAIVLICALIVPVSQILGLEGKPVIYKVLRDTLDRELELGSVVTVDRWFEPWNEMATYAPSNVVVTFTVPDEPYENYVQLQWREVTQRAIESGTIQGFIRLTRNHEDRAGLWAWPETHFAKRIAITNEAGLWMRRNGYALSDDFDAVNTNRLIIEIFYDLREDAIARKRAAGEQFGVFFNQTIPYEKSGPMGIFRFQTQQFMDWRALGERGELEVYNLTDAPADVTLQISAVAPREAKVVSSNGKRFQFPAGQMQQWNLGPLTLAPGRNVVAFEDPRWGPSQSPLLISSVEVK